MPAVGLDFEYCAVKQTQTKSFTLVNPTAGMVNFEIQEDESGNSNFEIAPKNGKLHIEYLLKI
jgi:hypothetical protein